MRNYFCPNCGREYPIDKIRWHCECGSYLNIESKDIDFTEKPNKNYGMWRYQEFLNIKDDEIVTLGEPQTPLIPLDISGNKFLLKLDYLMPTGSFKDRGASLLISHLRRNGIKEIVEDSSGNAGCSIAAYAAKAGIKCHIVVPKNTDKKKLEQIKSYSAEIIFTENREDAAQKALELSKKFYYASHIWNAIFLEGIKTLAYEIREQTYGNPPDEIYLPVGNGSLLLGLYWGFNEIKNSGLIGKIPRLIAVQAENCAPIYHNFYDLSPQKYQSTVAKGIAIKSPLRIKDIINVLRASKGKILTLSENEIAQAKKLCHHKGFYIETTAAVGFAGALQDNEHLITNNVIVILTGSGLKE